MPFYCHFCVIYVTENFEGLGIAGGLRRTYPTLDETANKQAKLRGD
jgi:hypothetical protein